MPLTVNTLQKTLHALTSGTYFGLATDEPRAGAFNEPMASYGYARKSISDAGGMSITTDTSSATATNSKKFYFNEAEGGDWGLITHLFIADSGTRGSGNLLYYGELTQATTISENCMPKFAEKAISITLTSSDLS